MPAPMGVIHLAQKPHAQQEEHEYRQQAKPRVARCRGNHADHERTQYGGGLAQHVEKPEVFTGAIGRNQLAEQGTTE